MKTIRYDQIIPTPWKNGLGVTRQILIFPEEATLTNFMFRVSAASVTQTGPFSEYPKINRSLAVLEGKALKLELKDELISFIPEETIIHFHGTDHACVTDCPNPVLDFGVMSQEDLVTHTLNKLDWAYGTTYTRKTSCTLIFSLNSGDVCLSIDNNEVILHKYDSLFLAPQDSKSLLLHPVDGAAVSHPTFFIAEFSLLE